MESWFSQLDTFEQVVWPIAGIAALFFLLKLLLQLFGLGGDAVEVLEAVDAVDASDATEASEAANALDVAEAVEVLHLFTVHGIALFFAIGGFASLAVYERFPSAVVASIIGIVAGFLAMYVHAYLMRSMKKLTADGTVHKKDAVGEIGEVYLVVPEYGKGEGKVNVKINGVLREFNAISRDDRPIPTGAKVRVIECAGDCLVVQNVDEENV